MKAQRWYEIDGDKAMIFGLGLIGLKILTAAQHVLAVIEG